MVVPRYRFRIAWRSWAWTSWRRELDTWWACECFGFFADGITIDHWYFLILGYTKQSLDPGHHEDLDRRPYSGKAWLMGSFLMFKDPRTVILRLSDSKSKIKIDPNVAVPATMRWGPGGEDEPSHPLDDKTKDWHDSLVAGFCFQPFQACLVVATYAITDPFKI